MSARLTQLERTRESFLGTAAHQLVRARGRYALVLRRRDAGARDFGRLPGQPHLQLHTALDVLTLQREPPRFEARLLGARRVAPTIEEVP